MKTRTFINTIRKIKTMRNMKISMNKKTRINILINTGAEMITRI